MGRKRSPLDRPPQDPRNILPMRETVARGLQMLEDAFKKDQQLYLLSAMKEEGLDPKKWGADLGAMAFKRIAKAPAAQPPAMPHLVPDGIEPDGDGEDTSDDHDRETEIA